MLPLSIWTKFTNNGKQWAAVVNVMSHDPWIMGVLVSIIFQNPAFFNNTVWLPVHVNGQYITSSVSFD